MLLNDALCDHLVIVLCQDSVQRKLLAEDNFTFKKASEIAQAIKQADRNIYEMKTVESSRK